MSGPLPGAMSYKKPACSFLDLSQPAGSCGIQLIPVMRPGCPVVAPSGS